MFTGIIEEIGKVLNLYRKINSLNIEIEAFDTVKESKLGDSICVNGVCLTVTKLTEKSFFADVSPETYEKTNLKFLKSGSYVNLEKSLTLSKPLGGHIVTGHIDDMGKILAINELRDFYEIIIQFPENLRKYIVEKGSIAINGISLTVNKINGNNISLMIIPHTLKETNLKYCKAGDFVNIEVDIIGKYVENMLKYNDKKSNINIEFLKQHGFA